MKTWLAIFLVIFVISLIFGFVASMIDDDESYEDDEYVDVETGDDEAGFLEASGLTMDDALELMVGAVVLVILFFYLLNADKNGSRIFMPADVNLLFPSPMKPQSVLMFRLSTQLGIALLGGFYMIFQLPNLTLNMGLSVWAAIALVVAWGVMSACAILLQMLLYTLASTYPSVKRFLRPVIFGVLAAIAVGFVIFARSTGLGYIASAVRFFNAPVTRFIPVWGWIKGFCVFVSEGNILGVVLTALATVVFMAVLVYVIWHIKADFYEDAMAKSEETAELLELANQEKSTGLIRRKKDRSERLRRDGLTRGEGASVFFHKALYNRFRFAHLGVFTKTSELYIVAAAAVACVCRFAAETQSFTALGLVLAGLVFFRALGNPVVQDVNTSFFVLIPEGVWSKFFWSLFGGTANCFLDILPATVIGALILGADPLSALAWIPLIVSMDFYASSVITFIELSCPVSTGKLLKQIVGILFVYFGLAPMVICVVVGFALGAPTAGFVASAIINAALGLVFFALSPLFIEPSAGRGVFVGSRYVNLRDAKRNFSRIGLGCFTILILGSVLQLVASLIASLSFHDTPMPEYLSWIVIFAPLYAVAMPVGYLILRSAPAAPKRDEKLRFRDFAAAVPIAIFLMYAGNIVGVLVTSLVASLLHITVTNPVESLAMGRSLVGKVLVMVVLAPLIEEFIFRKQIIDRTRAYGERLSVVISALIFGLFHGNLSQFFYAFTLGLLLGYIYLKTGRLRYSAALHMFINFLGGVVSSWLLESIDLDALGSGELTIEAAMALFSSPAVLGLIAYGLFIITFFVLGLVLFILRVRRVDFAQSELQLPRGKRFSTVFLNVGMILFTLLCLASIVLSYIEL